jgi:cell division protein FtsL
MKRFPQQQQNSRIHRKRDVSALYRLALLLFCGFVLASGFVLAAQQHFAAVQYGYQNESLRFEKKRLIEERQRLALEREAVASPGRLESAARRLGLRPATAGQIMTLDPMSVVARMSPVKSKTKSSSLAHR